MKEKVSIVVAIYKSERFLKKLIHSLINQTYDNLEIILVDDGSPDSSGRICDYYSTLDDRIIVFHKNNEGACKARDFGISHATGDLLMIVDGDDWLSLDCVQYLYDVLKQTDSDMSLSDKIFTTRDQKQILSDNVEIWSSEEAICKIIYPHMEIGPWSKLFKMSLIKDNNISFNVPWSGEGLYFATMSAGYSRRVGVGHRKVYNYRLNNINSGLTKYNVVMGINALWNIKNIKEVLPIKTKRTLTACDWHIWKNNYFVLFLINATHEFDKYKIEYKQCRSYLLKKGFITAFKCELPLKSKIGMILTSLFPSYKIKKQIKIRNHQLQKDIRNLNNDD